MAKHIIFLKEGSDAVLATLTAILMHHERSYQITGSVHPLPIAKETHAALEYQGELFRSVSFRVTSLDRRMQNIINLVSLQSQRIDKPTCNVAYRADFVDINTVFQPRYPKRQPRPA